MKSADTVPLNEECIEDIASNLGEDILKHFLSCVLPEYKIRPQLQPGGWSMLVFPEVFFCVFAPLPFQSIKLESVPNIIGANLTLPLCCTLEEMMKKNLCICIIYFFKSC